MINNLETPLLNKSSSTSNPLEFVPPANREYFKDLFQDLLFMALSMDKDQFKNVKIVSNN